MSTLDGDLNMKCTIKDIAAELGLSRNTVSKALKHNPEVSKRTQDIVLKKAIEMGYTAADVTDTTAIVTQEIGNKRSSGAILFLTRAHSYESEFWPSVLRGIETVLSQNGFQLIFANMTDLELANGTLPKTVLTTNIAGIIAVEICHNRIWHHLLSLDVPIVTVDAPKDYLNLLGKVDIIMMENKLNTYKIIDSLIKKGARSFSFVGDLYSPNVGIGFQERFDALTESLAQHGLIRNDTCSITSETSDTINNSTVLSDYISNMPQLPDVFFCGNDWNAIQMIYSLQSLGYKVPEDVRVVGFDNIPISEKIIPALTTIDTPKTYLGELAAQRIVARINHPEIPCIFTKVSTKLIVRESTR